MKVETPPVDRRWAGYDGFYGGYLVGLLVDAAVAASTYRLASISVNFIARFIVDEVEIEFDRAHRGRSTERRSTAAAPRFAERIHPSNCLMYRQNPEDDRLSARQNSSMSAQIRLNTGHVTVDTVNVRCITFRALEGSPAIPAQVSLPGPRGRALLPC